MKSVTPFLEHAAARCTANGVALTLVPRVTTKFGDLGEFDHERRRLAVCVNDSGWLTTLAHELSHMDQWIAGGRVWVDVCGTPDAYTEFDAWLSGKRRVGPRALISLVRRIQRCELDAERRTLRAIRRFGLGDVKAYSKRANYDVWRYEAARVLKRWPDDPTEAVAQMPERLMRADEIGRLPVGFGLA